MLEGDIFDKLAFQGMRDKEIVVAIATTIWNEANQDRNPSPWIYWPTRERIERSVNVLVQRFGKIGKMTRKNLVNEIDREMKRRARREAKKDGKELYFFK